MLRISLVEREWISRLAYCCIRSWWVLFFRIFSFSHSMFLGACVRVRSLTCSLARSLSHIRTSIADERCDMLRIMWISIGFIWIFFRVNLLEQALKLSISLLLSGHNDSWIYANKIICCYTVLLLLAVFFSFFLPFLVACSPLLLLLTIAAFACIIVLNFCVYCKHANEEKFRRCWIY